MRLYEDIHHRNRSVTLLLLLIVGLGCPTISCFTPTITRKKNKSSTFLHNNIQKDDDNDRLASFESSDSSSKNIVSFLTNAVNTFFSKQEKMVVLDGTYILYTYMYIYLSDFYLKCLWDHLMKFMK